MSLTDYYNPEQGVMLITPNGARRYTDNLGSFSAVDASIALPYGVSKAAVDSAWESGEIYYCDEVSGIVKKIQYDGTVLATLQLQRPSALSVIQNDLVMATSVTYPPQQNQGCWISDPQDSKLVKVDNDLRIVLEVNGVPSSHGVSWDTDGGCYALANNGQSIFKVSSEGVVLSTILTSNLVPAASKATELIGDAEGYVWVLADDMVYKLRYNNIEIVQYVAIDPLGNLTASSSSSTSSFEGTSSTSSSSESSSSSPDSESLSTSTSSSSSSVDSSTSSESSSTEPEEIHVAGIDVDRSDDQYLYVIGGNSVGGWIQKYYSDGGLAQETQGLDIGYPYVVKAVQGLNSTSVFVLSDTSKWDEEGYGSSSSSDSSSSSSSLIYSSSSSSLLHSSSSSSVSSSSSSSEQYSSSSSSSYSSGEIDSRYLAAGFTVPAGYNGCYEFVDYVNGMPRFYNGQEYLYFHGTRHRYEIGLGGIFWAADFPFDPANGGLIYTSGNPGLWPPSFVGAGCSSSSSEQYSSSSSSSLELRFFGSGFSNATYDGCYEYQGYQAGFPWYKNASNRIMLFDSIAKKYTIHFVYDADDFHLDPTNGGLPYTKRSTGLPDGSVTLGCSSSSSGP